MALLSRIVPVLFIVQATCVLHVWSYPTTHDHESEVELEKKYFLEPYGDSLLDKRYFLEPYGDALLDKRNYAVRYPNQLESRYHQADSVDDSFEESNNKFQKRYFLEPFGDSLLDKRGDVRFYDDLPLTKHARMGGRKKHLKTYMSNYDDSKQKRYFLEPFGDSLLDKRSAGHNFESSSLANESFKSSNGNKEKSVHSEHINQSK